MPGGLPKSISGGGGPSGGQRVGLRLVESSTTGPQRLPTPYPVAPPPSCELVAPRGGETRERSAGAGFTVPAPLGSSRRVRKEGVQAAN